MKTTIRGHIPFVSDRLSDDQFQLLKNKRRDSRFKPDREFIANAVEEFLEAGGKIKIIDIFESEVSNYYYTDDLEDFFK